MQNPEMMWIPFGASRLAGILLILKFTRASAPVFFASSTIERLDFFLYIGRKYIYLQFSDSFIIRCIGIRAYEETSLRISPEIQEG